MAITTPDAVPGELINASWGDAVRADLNTHDTAIAGKVAKAGDDMTGTLTVGGNPYASAAGVSFTPGGTAGVQRNQSGTNLSLFKSGSGFAAGNFFAGFFGQTSATVLGTIAMVNSTTVAYNTTSDPRVKGVAAQRGIGDAAARAQQLGRLAWEGHYLDPETGEADPMTWDLLSSHDVEDVAAYAVTGERDATDDDGNPVYQQVAYPALVPLLFAALAQALDRIDALEAAA